MIYMWFILYVFVSSLISPLIMASNSTKISRIEDLSFFNQIQEFAKWEEENLFRPQSSTVSPRRINETNVTSVVPILYSNLTNHTFILPIVKQYFNNSNNLLNALNASFSSQGLRKKHRPNWTITSGVFADKEVGDDCDEYIRPIREIPVAKPPPRYRPPKPRPKYKYSPSPKYWPKPNYWWDSSSSDDYTSGWSDGFFSDWSCSDDDDDESKLWFLGFSTPTEEKRLSIVPSSKLVTRVSSEFHNLYIDPKVKILEKRNYMESYPGFNEDEHIESRHSNITILQESNSNRNFAFKRIMALFLYCFL